MALNAFKTVLMDLLMMTYDHQDLKLDSYQYQLPTELIASRPTQRRENCRLLVYDALSHETTHAFFYQLDQFLPRGSGLVLNNSKVYPARVFGQKASGGQVEVVILDQEKNPAPCLLRQSGKKNKGQCIYFKDGVKAEIVDRNSQTFVLQFSIPPRDLCQNQGCMPLPPYIREGRGDRLDLKDYQTVFGRQEGSVAAPTAGLHFSQQLLEDLEQKSIHHSFVTLHVGMGTFKPVEASHILDHKMHSERYFIEPSELNKMNSYKNRIAVGTTSLRVLETCYKAGAIQFEGRDWKQTDIFLHPGKTIASISGLITNFHLPGSSLLMLVSALVGREKTLELYGEAIKNNYRFYSYGDAMLILL